MSTRPLDDEARDCQLRIHDILASSRGIDADEARALLRTLTELQRDFNSGLARLNVPSDTIPYNVD